MVCRYARPRPGLSRRTILAGGLALAGPARAAKMPAIRLGLVQFGTVQWIAEIIRRHGLDASHGFTLTTVPLASTDAGRIAIMGGQADIVVLDWPFAAVQRDHGENLCFAPLDSAAGGIMAPANTSIRTLADLKGKRLGVAGGPVDKSWLVVQAAARREAGLDLARAADIAYGAPPVLDAKLQQGALDAVLTFWNFAATLEAQGFVQVIGVADCAAALGLPRKLDLIGFVFHQDWAAAPGSGIDGFLAAVADAQHLLATVPAEWDAIRPLMGAPDDRLFARLRDRFAAVAAIPADAATEATTAARLFAILKETGGTQATGGLETLPGGLFWNAGNGAG